MAVFGGFGGDIASLGGAVGDLFKAQGNTAEAKSYSSAAQLEQQNAQLTSASTRIQETQMARSVTMSLGATQADIAGAGFTESGSALDILRSSAQQGALAKSLVNIQGAITENQYAAQAGADLAKAKAANEAQQAGTISAIASIGGALVSGGTQLASAGQTVAKGYDYISGLIGGSSAADAASIDSLTALNEFGDVGGDLAMSATDASITAGVDVGTTAATLDTSGIALGTSMDAVTTGIGDFLSGAAVDIGAGIADAAASAAAIAAGVGDAVASAASFIADAAAVALC